MVNKQKVNWHSRYKQLFASACDQQLQSFYKHSISDGNLAINEVPMVALDFETTGLNFKSDDIVSVGLVPFTLARIYCRESADWLVQPRQDLKEKSIVIHGITHSEVNDAPDLSVILNQLLAALTGKIIVVHFGAIERHFLNKALLARLGEGIEFAVIDTMEIEKRALQARQGLLGKIFNTKLDSLRLGDTRARYSLPAYNSHNALTDALATAELLQAQLCHHYRPDTPLSALWV
ncbi:MAG: 3'-5' exonuclease [Pseudoalteromonas sp.]